MPETGQEEAYTVGTLPAGTWNRNLPLPPPPSRRDLNHHARSPIFAGGTGP